MGLQTIYLGSSTLSIKGGGLWGVAADSRV